MKRGSLSLKNCFQLSKQTRPPLSSLGSAFKNFEPLDFLVAFVSILRLLIILLALTLRAKFIAKSNGIDLT